VDTEELVALVARLMEGRFDSDEDLDRAAALFQASVPHPRALDLVFHWECDSRLRRPRVRW
jgi:hypothetical protein